MPPKVERGEIDEQAPFTAETVIEVLRAAKVLRGDPSPELICQAERLARQVRNERRAATFNLDAKTENETIVKARDLITELLPLLRPIALNKMELAAIADPDSASLLRGRAGEIVDIESRLKIALDGVKIDGMKLGAALALYEFPGPGERARRSWTNIWPVIRDDVVEAVRLANGKDNGVPGRRDGPLVRFIGQLIPFITAEMPSADTIVSEIKKAERKRSAVART